MKSGSEFHAIGPATENNAGNYSQQRRLRWFGHAQRMEDYRRAKQALYR